MEQNNTQTTCGTGFTYRDSVKGILSLDSAKKMISRFLYGNYIKCYSKEYDLVGNGENRIKHLSLYLGVHEKSIFNVLMSKDDDHIDMRKKTMRIRLKINRDLINLFLMTKFEEGKDG
jgi:hypothetical protein